MSDFDHILNIIVCLHQEPEDAQQLLINHIAHWKQVRTR